MKTSKFHPEQTASSKTAATTIRLAWWLLRGSRRRLAVLLGCLALAVAGRVAIQTVVAQVERQTATESRSLLGGDLELASSKPLAGQSATIAAVLPAGSVISSGARLTTMVTVGDAGAGLARPVELRAVDAAWPLGGEVLASLATSGPINRDESQHLCRLVSGDTAPAGTITAAANSDAHPALAQAELFTQLGLPVGTVVRLGGTHIRLAGVLRDEPGLAVSAFSVGPRIVVSVAALEASGLAGAGARLTHLQLIIIPDPRQEKDLVKRIRTALGQDPERDAPPGSMGPPRDGVAVRSAQDAQAQASRIIERFADFLRLVAQVALVLGTVGVASLMRGHLLDRIEDLALLRVLGATPGRLARIVLAQAAILGIGGGFLGALLGVGLASSIPLIIGGLAMPGIDLPALLGGPLLGVVVAVAATLVPLSAVIRQHPLPQLRGEPPTESSPWRWPLLIGLTAALVGLAVWDSRSLQLGGGFIAAVLLSALILAGIARLVLPGIAALRHPLIRMLRQVGQPALGAAVGHGLANLDRRANRPVAAAVALGLGAVLLGSLMTYRASLIHELDPQRSDLPGLFVIDLQADQIEPFKAACAKVGAGVPTTAPIITARLRPGSTTRATTVDGSRDAESRRFFRDREQRLSWRSALDPSETITAGTWMTTPGDPDKPEASLEERFAERLGVGVGDSVTFDILGIPLTVKVTSLRKVDWTSFRPNFMVLVSPAGLEGAPDTWIAAVPAMAEGPRRALQATLIQRFPNCTAFDVTEIGQRVVALLDRLAWIIRLLALLALAAGLVILVGMALATAAQRRQEGALLRVLGAHRHHLALAVVAEFAALGLFAGTLGAALATGVATWLVGHVLGLEVTIPWLELALLSAGVGVMSALVGVITCRSAWTTPPLQVLRQ